MKVENIQGVGANQFIVNDADFNVIGLRFVLDLTVPELNITGNHIINGSVAGIVPIKSEGNFR